MLKNKFTYLEYFFLEKCSYIQAYFVYFLLDLVLPNTSLLRSKIINLLNIKPIYTYTKNEFTRLYLKHYFNTIILDLIKPNKDINPYGIVVINLAMELHKEKVNKYAIINHVEDIDYLIPSLELWFAYKEEQDEDRKKLLYLEVKRNNLLVIALHNEHKVMFNRFTSELYNLTRTIYYKHDPTRDNNIRVLRKAIKNLTENELSLLEIVK